MRFWLSALIDAVSIVVFALIGRLSHGESAGPLGVWNTAWPFLTGAALGTVAARAWLRPGSLPTGVVIWAGTLVGGMVLRVLTGDTIAVAFVIVAGITLAVFLLGWRAAYVLIGRARSRTRDRVGADA